MGTKPSIAPGRTRSPSPGSRQQWPVGIRREQLADLLREQLASGQLTSRVPSVKTLAQQHGVSHITVERSLTILREEGLIRSVIGKGCYVTRQTPSSG
ncbi:MAG TPA: hypothetical protein DHU96_28615 [Actinobacteria bacterium]|nr:hypothetical protein [Actinomycetota bacterium]